MPSSTIKSAVTFLFLLAAGTPSRLDAQDLLDLLGPEEVPTEIVTNAFKSSRVIIGQSIENSAGGVLAFRIRHRFGRINGGAYELYGLDQATIRLGLDYGITDRLTLGIGRSTHKKEIDGFMKYKLLRQSTGKINMPVSVIAVAGMMINMLHYPDPERANYFTSRLAYFYQVAAGRKFSERFTLQSGPLLVHRNLVATTADPSDVWAAEVGSRLKISKRVAITQEYFAVLTPGVTETFRNVLSLGLDIETGGHVFQLHFSNATGMNERAFLTETDGTWKEGDIQFGFNISRVFTVADKRKKSKS